VRRAAPPRAARRANRRQAGACDRCARARAGWHSPRHYPNFNTSSPYLACEEGDPAPECKNLDAEFEGLSVPQARARVERGLVVWRECLNETKPSHFSFPGQWADPPMLALLRDEYGFTLRTLFDGLVGKIYHCEDSWCKVTCKAWFVDAI
jgi:hypothetical protein